MLDFCSLLFILHNIQKEVAKETLLILLHLLITLPLHQSLISFYIYIIHTFLYANSINPIAIFQMKKVSTTTACSFAFFFCFLFWSVTGRFLQYDDGEQVSDGVYNHGDKHEQSFFLRFLGFSDSEEYCEQMYGFLPCSSNLPGHLFLIVVYEYLLYHGESYAGGDGRIFGVLGNNFFGASVFQLLDSLPDSLILLGRFPYVVTLKFNC